MAAITNHEINRPNWQTIVILTLGFWLSGSLVLDLVIMPSLYTTGMMSQPGFASAGYSIFWLFNRLELLCAAVALTGLLVLNLQGKALTAKSRLVIALSVFLLGVALLDTYGLTPQMSAMGLNLNLFDPNPQLPAAMKSMQFGYWLLETLKLLTCGIILRLSYPQQAEG